MDSRNLVNPVISQYFSSDSPLRSLLSQGPPRDTSALAKILGKQLETDSYAKLPVPREQDFAGKGPEEILRLLEQAAGVRQSFIDQNKYGGATDSTVSNLAGLGLLRGMRNPMTASSVLATGMGMGGEEKAKAMEKLPPWAQKGAETLVPLLPLLTMLGGKRGGMILDYLRKLGGK